MTAISRANVASSFTVVKGAMIAETYTAFSRWDFALSKRENLDRLRLDNSIGAGSTTWLRDVAKVLNRRYEPAGRDRPLVRLAQSGCDLHEWKPILLWHMTRDEFLVRDFLQNWLSDAYDSGAFRIHSSDVMAYLSAISSRGGRTEHPWSETTKKRVAVGLLHIASSFGLLQGAVAREFTGYHLPERSFIYLLHAMMEELGSPSKVIASPGWRLFLLRPTDVENELLRLHQFRKLDYQVAGSIVQLSLPCANSERYAERMVA
ncbi:BrxA family protein [Nonomuraea purpurea]|uniref:BrxA family protein n=1 Tax=Nonomuraea purpurea TaxID=1849276 RepID=A0ABV8FZF6_9ACTN